MIVNWCFYYFFQQIWLFYYPREIVISFNYMNYMKFDVFIGAVENNFCNNNSIFNISKNIFL